jgi:hypothetical protein
MLFTSRCDAMAHGPAGIPKIITQASTSWTSNSKQQKFKFRSAFFFSNTQKTCVLLYYNNTQVFCDCIKKKSLTNIQRTCKSAGDQHSRSWTILTKNH